MKTVNIHAAKTHLSRLVEEAAQGQEFVIAKAGKPMVKVVPLQTESATVRPPRRGFLDHMHWEIPDDFNTLDQAWIEEQFYGGGEDEKR